MSDAPTATAPTDPATGVTQAPAPDASWRSVPAIISYAGFFAFLYVSTGIFAIILTKTKVDPTMLTVLGGLVTAVGSLLTAIAAYWLASSYSANRAAQKKDELLAIQAANSNTPPPPAAAEARGAAA